MRNCNSSNLQLTEQGGKEGRGKEKYDANKDLYHSLVEGEKEQSKSNQASKPVQLRFKRCMPGETDENWGWSVADRGQKGAREREDKHTLNNK